MSISTRIVKTTAVSVAVIVIVGVAFLRRSNSRTDTRQPPTFGAATTNPAVARDSSERLSTLSPPADEDEEEAEREAEEGGSRAPIRMKVSQAGAAIEQLKPGTKPAA